MKLNENKVNNWKKAMLPLSFTFSSLLNIGFYYIGLAFQENPARKYGFILGGIAFAILAGLTFLHIIRKERFKWYVWALWCGVLGFFFGGFASAVYNHGVHYLIVDYLSQFIVFCVPAFLIGICSAKWRTEQHLVPTLEKLSFFVLPAALTYFMQVMFDANPFNWGRDLGIIGYMPFAYTLMPLLMALIIRFADKEDLIIPFVNRKISHPQIVRFSMIMVFWIALYSSGTRGAMICIICFLAFLLLFKLIRREKAKSTFFISAIMVVVLAFNLFVFAPTGMRWLGRMDMFLDGLLSGQIITSPEDDKIGSNIDDMVALNPTNPSEPSDSKEPSASIDLNNHGITSRGTLFEIAFKEFLKKPLFGMGPGSYSVKYNMFPHNVILELLAETGIVGAVFIIFLTLFSIIKLIKAALKDRNVLFILLFFITYAVQANCNGSIWFCSALLCALGYGLTFRATDKPALEQDFEITGEKK